MGGGIEGEDEVDEEEVIECLLFSSDEEVGSTSNASSDEDDDEEDDDEVVVLGADDEDDDDDVIDMAVKLGTVVGESRCCSFDSSSESITSIGVGVVTPAVIPTGGAGFLGGEELALF